MREPRIAAYQLNADVYCPACIGLVTHRHITLNWDDPPEADPSGYFGSDPELCLDDLAERVGIDRYDSGDFPKVVFADQIDHDSEVWVCGECYGGIAV